MKKLFSLLLGACTVFAACTDDVENIRQDGSTKLAVNVKVNPTSRAMVHGTALPGGSSIGINVTDASGNPYDGKNAGYLNVQYTATGEAGAQTWAPATDAVLLSGTEGKMHAYYPWTTGIDYTAVAVDVADQIDWMYAADTYTVSDAKNAHEIVLSHAQTAVNVNLKRDASYTGVGLVEALTVTSEGLASTASLDTRDGSFASITGANTAISIIEAPYTLDGSTLSSQENPYMFIPASTETKDFTVSATLDGKSYSHKVTMAEAFAPGKVYKINVTFKNTGLEVSTVTLVDWTETELGDAEFKPGQDAIQDPYADYIQLTYLVEDASQSVDILNIPSGPMSLRSRSVSFSIDMVEELIVEGVSISPVTSYKFSQAGTYTVYLKLKDMTYIPKYMCNDLLLLWKVVIPNSVAEIGDYAFSQSGLEDIIIGAGVQTIGENMFGECVRLKSIVIDINNIVYDSRNNCNAIMETATNTLVVGCKNTFIPQGCQAIGYDAFQGCKGLTSITIPNSVINIGMYAFRECTELKEIVIEDGVEKIEDGAFENCTALTEIISKAKTAPIIDVSTFQYVKTGGVLYIPVGATGYDAWMSTSNYYLGKYGWTIQEMTD